MSSEVCLIYKSLLLDFNSSCPNGPDKPFYFWHGLKKPHIAADAPLPQFNWGKKNSVVHVVVYTKELTLTRWSSLCAVVAVVGLLGTSDPSLPARLCYRKPVATVTGTDAPFFPVFSSLPFSKCVGIEFCRRKAPRSRKDQEITGWRGERMCLFCFFSWFR